MWIYRISTGEIHSPSGLRLGKGYSGFGEAANDPKMVKERGVGPIPPGMWKIGEAYCHKNLGPVCMNLDPAIATDTFGRSLFRIHGDNSTPDPHDASHGCIILNAACRRAIAASPDKILEVVE